MSSAALFTVAKMRNQPRCSTVNEWIKKLIYIYIMEYYSAIKKNEIMPFSRKWVELEIMLSEINQAQKARYCMFFSCLWNLDLK
jgi:hypothetical protein